MGAWPVVWCQGRDPESGGRRSSRNVFELPPACLLRLFVGYSHHQSSRLCRRPVCLTHLRPHAIVRHAYRGGTVTVSCWRSPTMLEPVEKIWMDGKFVGWGEANVHVLTHSLHYGLAAFEGLRCYKGKSGSAIFRLQEHVDRLFDSAHIGMMQMPFDKKQVAEAIVETVKINKLEACYIRPLLYIGHGAM